MLHLAIFIPGFIEKIFTGRKVLDGRFSQIKCMPFGVVQKSDLVLMKKSGGHCMGYFTVGEVSSYEDLSCRKLKSIVQKYWDDLAMSDEFWQRKKSSKYLTLIEIKKPSKFRVPVAVRKKSLSGWIALGGAAQTQIQLF